MGNDSAAAVLVDAAGNEITNTLDGARYRLDVNSKQADDWPTFTRSMWLGKRINVTSTGGIVEGGIHPHVLGESQEGSGSTLATVASSTDVAGQVFRSGVDNVQHARLALSVAGGSSGEGSDDFESYADTAALVAKWVKSGAGTTTVSLVTNHGGRTGQQMQFSIAKADSDGDKIRRTFTVAEDWTTLEDYVVWMWEEEPEKVQVHIRYSDGTNSASILVDGIAVKDTWHEHRDPLASFVNDGPTAPNIAAVAWVEYEVVKDDKTALVVIDDQEFRADPGTIDIEVYNVASQTPTTLGTLVATDTVQLLNQSSALYLAAFGGVTLSAGSYYALVIRNPSVAGITIGLLGQVGGAYSSGDAISSSDSGTTVTNITGDDAFFVIFPRVDAVPTTVRVKADADPGHTEIDVFTENPTTESFIRYHVHHEHMATRVEEWDISPFLLTAPEEIELMAQHDRDSAVSWLHISVRFRFAPITIYG